MFYSRRWLLVSWVLFVGTLQAYQLKNLFWDSPVVELSVLSKELKEPLLEAMAVWNSVSCNPIQLRLNPSSVNQVVLKRAGDWEYESQALGMTIHTYFSNPPLIDHVEVQINHGGRTWSDVDYKNVLLHELGHVLGLDHSEPELFQAAMHPYTQLGLAKLTLSTDDINGVCALRLLPPSSHSQASEPKQMQFTQGKTGCSQTQASSDLSLLFSMIMLIALGRRVRFRRCACVLGIEKKKHV